MHPFLDTSKLTDEEIIDKLGRAYSIMNMQVSLGHDPTVASIREVISALEDERNKRTQTMVREESKRKNPNELKPLELGKLE